jgi:hypothetical protein
MVLEDTEVILNIELLGIYIYGIQRCYIVGDTSRVEF